MKARAPEEVLGVARPKAGVSWDDLDGVLAGVGVLVQVEAVVGAAAGVAAGVGADGLEVRVGGGAVFSGPPLKKKDAGYSKRKPKSCGSA